MMIIIAVEKELMVVQQSHFAAFTIVQHAASVEEAQKWIDATMVSHAPYRFIHTDYRNWLNENCADYWFGNNILRHLQFKSENDALLFKLRFG